jgi:hypothetical protein
MDTKPLSPHTPIDIRASPTQELTEEEVLNAIPATGLKGRFLRFKKRRPLLYVCLQAGMVGLVSVTLLILTLRALLPPIDPEDRDKIRIPRNFESLQGLNEVLQVYNERNFFRVLASFCLVYFFLQAFSLPGSMYLSILSGALYGLWALPLVCFVRYRFRPNAKMLSQHSAWRPEPPSAMAFPVFSGPHSCWLLRNGGIGWLNGGNEYEHTKRTSYPT